MSRNSVLYLKSRKCIGKPVRFFLMLGNVGHNFVDLEID